MDGNMTAADVTVGIANASANATAVVTAAAADDSGLSPGSVVLRVILASFLLMVLCCCLACLCSCWCLLHRGIPPECRDGVEATLQQMENRGYLPKLNDPPVGAATTVVEPPPSGQRVIAALDRLESGGYLPKFEDDSAPGGSSPRGAPVPMPVAAAGQPRTRCPPMVAAPQKAASPAPALAPGSCQRQSPQSRLPSRDTGPKPTPTPKGLTRM
mmetsp:Transcript_64806/g.163204  ORF Transcript_64806/g.163204 Transcript_64806/m.163204 type:complete len:214 (-) Transcript_64806:92-733(-)